MKYKLILSIGMLLCISTVFAQQTVDVRDTVKQHIFAFGEIQYLEDTLGKYNLKDMVTHPRDYHFLQSQTSTPQNYNLASVYWYRIRIKYPLKTANNWVIEFFDQTIDSITAYIPDNKGHYTAIENGSSFKFQHRQFNHKNFLISLRQDHSPDGVYYFRIKSHAMANVIIVLRSINWFVGYAIDEYLLFGVFYGMIIVFAFYNFLMFLAIRQKQYVYYILYIICVGIYQLCIDGLAYQYIWPDWPKWNEYAYGLALFFLSVFALLFTSNFLNLKQTSTKLWRLVNFVLLCRVIYFIACLTVSEKLFAYKFVEIIPLAVAFCAGIYTWHQGFRAARFFVIGYGFIFIGFLIKLFITLNIKWLIPGAAGYYSLNICFILEMVFLGFAMGDKVRILKREKELAQEERIEEFIINEQLKDIITNKLEQQVEERTKEVIKNAKIIEQQNKELSKVNSILQLQAEEISRINVLLEHDNIELKSSVEKVTRARIMSADVDFEEFSKTYPDQDSCFTFLANLKWSNGFCCKKCGHNQFFNGHTPYSRRCRKCDYDESVMAYTIFQNSRIPITKAFYMIFLIYSSKGKLSSHKLAEILSLRQSTCWAYASKIKNHIADKKKSNDKRKSQGWSSVVLEVD